MRFSFGKTDSVKPGEQSNKMFTTVLAHDRRNALSSFCFYDLRKLKRDTAAGEELDELILKFEKFEVFLRVVNLEDKLFVSLS